MPASGFHWMACRLAVWLALAGCYVAAAQDWPTDDRSPAPSGSDAGNDSAARKQAAADSKTVDIDEEFRELLQDWERFRAVRTQQPENRKALELGMRRVKRHLVRLGEATAPQLESADIAGAATGHEATQERDTVQPSGPVESVHTPPDEATINRYIEALDKTHFPGKPLARVPLESRTVSNVAADWVNEVASVAKTESQRVLGLLANPSSSNDEIDSGVRRLGKLIRRLDMPPPETSPSRPRQQ